MQRAIAITELKPILAAQRSHRAHEAPALGFTAPALRGIGLAGQRIEQRIDVRRDREPEMLEIVAGIDDGRYRSRRNGVAEAEHQFRPADAARQDGDVAAQRNRSSSTGRTSAAAGVSATVQLNPRTSAAGTPSAPSPRSEEHTSELQSLML